MTAQPVEQRSDHSARHRAELQTVAAEQPGDEGRVPAELEAVAAEPLEGHEAKQQSPQDAADVQAMDPEARRAWFATTTGKQRWTVVGRTVQGRPPADPQYAARAACRGTSADLVELTSQAAAAEHVMHMCAQCPVLAWCAEDARDFPAHGLWAGVVLDGHKVAPGHVTEARTQTVPPGSPPGWLTSSRPTAR